MKAVVSSFFVTVLACLAMGYAMHRETARLRPAPGTPPVVSGKAPAGRPALAGCDGPLGAQLDDPARRAEFVSWLQNPGDEKLACGVFSRVFSRARHEGAWLRPERRLRECARHYPRWRQRGPVALGGDGVVVRELDGVAHGDH